MSPALGCEWGLPPPPSVKKLGRKENLNSLVWPEVEYFCFLMDKLKAIPRNAVPRLLPAPAPVPAAQPERVQKAGRGFLLHPQLLETWEELLFILKSKRADPGRPGSGRASPADWKGGWEFNPPFPEKLGITRDQQPAWPQFPAQTRIWRWVQSPRQLPAAKSIPKALQGCQHRLQEQGAWQESQKDTNP